MDPEAVSTAWQTLGRQLAICRKAAGYSQAEFAPLTGYGRSTVANVETGRQRVPRNFWQRADAALSTGSRLTSAYDEIGQHIAARCHATAEVLGAERSRNLRTSLRSGLGSETSDDMRDDVVTVTVRVDGGEMAVPVDRRMLLRSGLGALVEALVTEGPAHDALSTEPDHISPFDRLAVSSSAHISEVLDHLREQWHLLVKTDNLLEPRFALAGVRHQLAVIDSLATVTSDQTRVATVRLGARYAESAAWLYEDAGDLSRSRYWTNRAMEWAYEADDRVMLAWTMYRRSQQTGHTHNVGQVISLARAARRDDDKLPAPMRAAIRVQEAHGHALGADEPTTARLLDDAHRWAATDTNGDARSGHGSFCTAGYIEIHRANCYLALGRPKRSIALYEQALPALPAVYERDRAAALAGLANAYAMDGHPDQAADTARQALRMARSAGSRRIVHDIRTVGANLRPHHHCDQTVAALLDDLAQDNA